MPNLGCGTVFALTTDVRGKLTILQVLHTFSFNVSGSGDGDLPGGLTFDGVTDNLYGTTQVGGDAICNGGLGCGTIYMLKGPLLGGARPKEVILHTFEGTDGIGPYGRLLIDDHSGTIYGTTYGGGDSGHGAIFRLAPNSKRTKWAFTLLYSFAGSPDGAYPAAPLAMDSRGNLYATTKLGGSARNSRRERGTAYELSSDRHTESVLFDFRDDLTGQYPTTGLTVDATGTLYGANAGTCRKNAPCANVFALVPSLNGWIEQILHTFTDEDGSLPGGDALAMDSTGDLFGTTFFGGSGENGAVYEMKRNGNAFTFTPLSDFCSQGGSCPDGEQPFGVSLDPSGNLYGTTVEGGAGGLGEVFMLAP